MLLVSVLAAFLLSAFVWRLMRRIVLVAAACIAVAVAIAHIPYHNVNLASYRLLLGLFGHLVTTSLRHGISDYAHLGHHLAAQYHL